MRSLEQRLARLHGVTRRADTDSPDLGDLTRRIERLRGMSRQVRRGVETRTDAAGLKRLLGAREPAPGVLRVEEVLDGRLLHGDFPLYGFHGELTGLAEAAGRHAEDWLLLDTETTGLSGGTGTTVFMVGIARFRCGRLLLRQYLITRFSAEAAMLGCLRDEIGNGSTLVTYNGKSFDLPLLASRYRLHGLDDPLASLPHVDLLHPVRRRFRKYWDDCRLQTVEQRFLGFGRREDLPGSEAPAAWLDFVRQGRYDRLRGVREHNRLDLMSLAVLLPQLDRVLADPDYEPTSASGPRAVAVERSERRARLRDLRLLLAGGAPAALQPLRQRAATT